MTEPPLGRLTASLMLPAPAALQVPPAAPAHVHAQAANGAGKVSATVLAAASVNIFQVSSESEIDAFTVGICIPPILMNIEISEKARRQAILAMEADFPVYQRLGEWIELELQAAAADKKESCLENVSTKGGISEAMINSLQNDGSFARALERGMKRCREICAAISAKLDANAA